jgi:hypothetical protein
VLETGPCSPLNGNIFFTLVDCMQLSRNLHLWASHCNWLKNTETHVPWWNFNCFLRGGGEWGRAEYVVYVTWAKLFCYLTWLLFWALSFTMIWKADIFNGPIWVGTCFLFTREDRNRSNFLNTQVKKSNMDSVPNNVHVCYFTKFTVMIVLSTKE